MKRSHVFSLGVITAAIVIAGVIAYVFAGETTRGLLVNNGYSSKTRNDDGGISANQWRISFVTLTSDGSSVQGDPAAPITLVEFGDFQCEYCARFAKETEPQIYQNYIQTGKVNMIFKHLVHYGSDSDLAASASQCANDQGQFWDFYHILYADQNSFMLSQNTTLALKNLAHNIDGLNNQKFDSCLDGGTYKDIAKKDTQLAVSLGLQNTPSFVIVKSDGSSPQTLVGAYPFATFKGLLDKEIGGV